MEEYLEKKKFKIEGFLGNGAFGEVFQVYKYSDNCKYALKITKFISTNEADGFKYSREVNVMAKLNHSNIVRFYHSWRVKIKVPTSESNKAKSQTDGSELLSLSEEFQRLHLCNGSVISDDSDESSPHNSDGKKSNNSSSDEIVFDESPQPKQQFKVYDYLFIQIEYCNKGTLRNAIDNYGVDDDSLHLHLNVIKKYFREIVKGLDYIHRNSIVHRDLNPNNIFLNQEGVIKIGDFGLAKIVNHHDDGLISCCGTNFYIAPEVHQQVNSGTKADLYSLGIMLVEMCLPAMTAMEKNKEIFPLTPSKLHEFCGRWPNIKHFALLISNLLINRYYKRPDCKDILKTLKKMNDASQIPKNSPITIDHYYINNLMHRRLQSYDTKAQFIDIATNIFQFFGGHNINIGIPKKIIAKVTLEERNYYDSYNQYQVLSAPRLPFCLYAILNDLQNIRRYSCEKIDKIGKQTCAFPKSECVFDCISTMNDDATIHAEMLWLVKTVLDGTIRISSDGKSLVFMINHIILQKKLLPLLVKNNQELIMTIGCAQDFILTKIENFEEQTQILNGLQELEKTIEKTSTYGIHSKDIKVAPALVTKTYPSSFMFHAVLDDVVVASGERFDKLMDQYSSLVPRKEAFNGKAIGVAFNVNEISKLIVQDCCIHVVIVAASFDGIPLHRKLLENGVKCAGICDQFWENVPLDDKPAWIIEMLSDNSMKLLQISYASHETIFTETCTGDWLDDEYFSTVLETILENENNN